MHIYEPAIYLMSTYVAHAVAWLVQNGLPSLSWGHSRAVMLGKISYTMRRHPSPFRGTNAAISHPLHAGILAGMSTTLIQLFIEFLFIHYPKVYILTK
jgi:hypothetical protein